MTKTDETNLLHSVAVTVVDGKAKATFSCAGTRTSACHFYPDVDEWRDGDGHARVEHDNCWLQDWFDVGPEAAIYDGPDAIDVGHGYEHPLFARTGTIQTEYGDGYITWCFDEPRPTVTTPEPITRPNGTAYQPRKLRAFALNVDDEQEEVLVLGTHDVDIAYPVAKREMGKLFREGAFLGSPRKVWKTQKLSHFVEGAPWYEYADDPERGAAGVLFDVVYPNTTSTALAAEPAAPDGTPEPAK